MANYYRRFIQGFAAITKPLTQLLKKGVKWEWQEPQEQAFQTLKKKLTTTLTLSYPDSTTPYRVCCDASGTGIGAALEQPDSKGLWRPVAYYSRSLRKGELNWTITEKECFAVVQSLKVWRHYVEGTEFEVITDHAALQWMFDQNEPKGRVARWILSVQALGKFKVTHRAGRVHRNGDALSRRPFIAAIKPDQRQSNLEELKEDSTIGMVLLNLDLHSNYQVLENQLYRVQNEKRLEPILQWVVPKSQREDYMKQYHDLPTGGHLGLKKTYSRMQKAVWWPTMRVDLHKYIQMCQKCQEFRTGSTATGLMKSLTAEYPWQRLCIDLKGPLPVSEEYKYVLTVKDIFSK
jgi:hypothetical protein